MLYPSMKTKKKLTPERKKQIFEQFAKDRVGVEKPTKRQLWGERAEWVAHNITRVFPDIPERGERKLISYHDRWYIIEKFDSSDLKY